MHTSRVLTRGVHGMRTAVSLLIICGLMIVVAPAATQADAAKEDMSPYAAKMHEVLKQYNRANRAFYSKKYDKAEGHLVGIFPLLEQLRPLAEQEGFLKTKKNQKIFDSHMLALKKGIHSILALVKAGDYEKAKQQSTKDLSATCNACHKKGAQHFPGFGSKPAPKTK